ncbi:alginate O-acetyltransferase [Azotobacter salinestris]|uniref:alginate O-acetyltransferase n=1 Tax=Azotobacter salinestris TaxID=69964 RepID=UPI001266DBB3|nr:alginate O-acetyltransferase [Azotobacter salinestris]
MNRTSNLLYAGTFIGGLVALSLWSVKGAVDFSAADNTPILNGKLALNFEKHYDAEFPIKRIGTNLWAALDFSLFGEGRPGVVIGANQWLFSDEEFKPTAAAANNIMDNQALIQGVRETLARHNVQLVMAILPAKARLYPEYFGEQRPAPLHEQLYQNFRQAVADAGIQAPDLLGPLQKAKTEAQVFLRTDTHWTPYGAQVVAGQLATAIKPSGLLPESGSVYVTETLPAGPHKGDLTNFLPLDPLFEELLPPPDQLVRHSTRPQEEQATGADDLFADNQVPVALVGTSYSADERWNFAGALRQALGSDLVNFAEDGRGPILPMLKFLQSDDFKNAPPRLVIWEFPERYLPTAYDLSEFDADWIAQLKAAGRQDKQLAGNTTTPQSARR